MMNQTESNPETVTTTVNRMHLIAIKHGLKARQMGMMITSARKGGSTGNLLALLSNVTGVKYPRSPKGIERALYHVSVLLTQTMTEEDIAAANAERERLIARSRAVCQS
jgi:hypothetical protein